MFILYFSLLKFPFQVSEKADIPDTELEVGVTQHIFLLLWFVFGCRRLTCVSLSQVSQGASCGNHWNRKSKNVLFQAILPFFCFCVEYVKFWCKFCLQKERYIQVSKVDDEERKRREQQKLEKEQVSLGWRWLLNGKCLSHSCSNCE